MTDQPHDTEARAFTRVGKQIMANGFHYADAADETAAAFILARLSTPAPAAQDGKEAIARIVGGLARNCADLHPETAAYNDGWTDALAKVIEVLPAAPALAQSDSGQ